MRLRQTAEYGALMVVLAFAILVSIVMLPVVALWMLIDHWRHA